MAVDTLALVSNALSQTFEKELARQFNRATVLASIVPAKAGGGKNAAWDTAFSGATAATVAEGADVSGGEYASDVNVPAVLDWAHYRSSFSVTETEIDAAASSVGIPTALEDIFGERINGSMTKLAALVNSDMFSGTGTDGSGNKTIVGLYGGSCDATGIYATINRATYSEWAGNVLANGSVARPLTTDLLATAEASIFTRSGKDFDFIIASPGVCRKYEALFQSLQRVSIDGVRGQTFGQGAQSRLESTGMFYKGRPILRYKDAPAGSLAMLMNDSFQAKWLPRAGDPSAQQRFEALKGSNGESPTVTQIPVRIVALAKTGDSIKMSLKLTMQCCVRRPNETALIKDISES